jgi:two-component system phosphate regulon sensor histidine kinase PhoR
VHREEPQAFNCAQLLNQCADVADGLALPRDIKVTRDVPPELPITTEYGRLQAIVMNLLGNAVEYNQSGGKVTLKAALNESTLTVSVSDTGRGIAQSDLLRVFEPFYRGSAHVGNETPNKVHFGLGLHLVDSHIKALGGECRIDSQLGVGTTVSIILPPG